MIVSWRSFRFVFLFVSLLFLFTSTIWSLFELRNIFQSKETVVNSKYILGDHQISTLDENQNYVISGSCYCESDEERRNVGVLTRGTSYVVAAVSSFVAYKLAKEYFEDECSKYFDKDECSTVRSEIEEIIKVDSLSEDLEDILEKIKNNPPKSDEEELRKSKDLSEKITKKIDTLLKEPELARKLKEEQDKMYHCKGSCLKNTHIRNPEGEKEASKYDCSGIVIYKDVPLASVVSDSYPYFWSKADLERRIEIARKYFKIRILDFECREKTKRFFIEIGSNKKITYSLCFGGSNEDFNENRNNIICEKK